MKDFTLEDVLQLTSYVPPKNRRNYRDGVGGRYQIQPSLTDGEEDDVEDDGEDQSSEERTTQRDNLVSLEECLKRIDENEIDYDLIAVLIVRLLKTKDDDGSILVFLPGAGEQLLQISICVVFHTPPLTAMSMNCLGIGEIDRAEKALQQIVKGDSLHILPLHGGIPPEKQQAVFSPPRNGVTKIILSTNVAETSITIPDW